MDKIVRLDPDWTSDAHRMASARMVSGLWWLVVLPRGGPQCAGSPTGTFGPWRVYVRTTHKDAAGWSRQSDSPTFVLPLELGLPDAAAAEYVARRWVRELIAATGGDPATVGIAVAVERERS